MKRSIKYHGASCSLYKDGLHSVFAHGPLEKKFIFAHEVKMMGIVHYTNDRFHFIFAHEVKMLGIMHYTNDRRACMSANALPFELLIVFTIVYVVFSARKCLRPFPLISLNR